MATLKVQGVRDRSQESALARGPLAGKVHVKDAALVQRSRAGAAEVSFEGLAPDDVVELELQDGLRVWMRVDDATREFAGRGRRGQAADVVEVPSELVVGPASRSFGGWAIKAMKVLGIDIEEKILDFVSDKVEGQLKPGPGLYRCSDTSADGLQPLRSLDGDGPALVFLHGTASSTSGSFGGLWSPEGGRLITPLFDAYGGRVLAFQHRTLTESPIVNALALVEALEQVLPPGAVVHLVSHSRGGMIGELLARGQRRGAAPITRDDLELFDDRPQDRASLQALTTALERARFEISRFVRVACPARGTTLADRRLDRYVSVLVNLGSLVPGFKANPVYDGLTSLLAGVLKKRTEPEELPGHRGDDADLAAGPDAEPPGRGVGCRPPRPRRRSRRRRLVRPPQDAGDGPLLPRRPRSRRQHAGDARRHRAHRRHPVLDRHRRSGHAFQLLRTR